MTRNVLTHLPNLSILSWHNVNVVISSDFDNMQDSDWLPYITTKLTFSPWIILALISMCEVTLPLATTSNERDLAPPFGTCTFVRPLKGLFWHWAFWQNPKNMRQSSTSFIISENKIIVSIWEWKSKYFLLFVEEAIKYNKCNVNKKV